MRDAGLDGRGQLPAGRLPQEVWHLRGPLGRQPNGPTAAPSPASPLELLALNGRKGPQRVEDPEAHVQSPKDVIIVRLVPVDDAVADVPEADHRAE